MDVRREPPRRPAARRRRRGRARRCGLPRRLFNALLRFSSRVEWRTLRATVAASDVIVEGRITGWVLGSPEPVSPPPSNLADVSVLVTLRVERVYKGGAPATLTFADIGTMLAAEQSADRYPSISVGIGGCGVYQNEDPTGRYVLLGLTRRPDGSYLASRLLAFFVGDGPDGNDYLEAVARLSRAGPIALPAAGNGLVADRAVSFVAVGALLSVTLALLAGVALRASALRRERCATGGTHRRGR